MTTVQPKVALRIEYVNSKDLEYSCGGGAKDKLRKGEQILVHKTPISIGRHYKDDDLRIYTLPQTDISREHAEIVRIDYNQSRYYLRDNSKHGTWLVRSNGEKIKLEKEREHELRFNEDIVWLADSIAFVVFDLEETPGVFPPLSGITIIDENMRTISVNGMEVKLEPEPFRLLETLMDHEGKFVSRNKIADELWPNDESINIDTSISNVVRRLRKPIEKIDTQHKYIQAINKSSATGQPGGYIFTQPKLGKNAKS